MLITKNDLATKLNVSQMTINRFMKRGMPYIKVGKQVRFDEGKVMAWIQETYNKEEK